MIFMKKEQWSWQILHNNILSNSIFIKGVPVYEDDAKNNSSSNANNNNNIIHKNVDSSSGISINIR